MNRKITQIIACAEPIGGPWLYAVCDDGTLWCRSVMPSVRNAWLEIEQIPQPEPEPQPGSQEWFKRHSAPISQNPYVGASPGPLGFPLFPK